MEMQDINYNKSEYVETVNIIFDIYKTLWLYLNIYIGHNFGFLGFRQQGKSPNSTLRIPEHCITRKSNRTVRCYYTG